MTKAQQSKTKIIRKKNWKKIILVALQQSELCEFVIKYFLRPSCV